MKHLKSTYYRWLVGMSASLFVALTLGLGLGATASAAPSVPTEAVKYMAAPGDCPTGQVKDDKGQCTISCPQLKNLHSTNKNAAGSGQGLNCFIRTYVNPFIKFLAGVVGVFVVISIVVGGIQYAMSADDPSKVSSAKQRIFQSVIGLLGFIFLMAFLQWVVPGGIRG